MTVFAHITDLHLVEHDHHKRCASDKSRLLYLNTGRRIDPGERLRKVREALRHASRADHVVVTGDMTEDGSDAQYELLGSLLSESRIPPRCVTLVPGNHDFYTAANAFDRALRGPLRAYAATSAHGRPIELGAAVVVPITTAIPHNFIRSSGALAPQDLVRLHAAAADVARMGKTLLVAQHHPPLGYENPLWNWIDGMHGTARNAELLRANDHLHVIHGHTHVAGSRSVRSDGPDQVHAGAAVLHSSDHVRFYDARDGELRVLDLGAPPAISNNAWHALGSASARATFC